MADPTGPTCAVCGDGISQDGAACSMCLALREAAAVGAKPRGVPLRVYGGYLEARAALRANAPAAATRTLQWLLSYIAEERGTPAEKSLVAKVDKLRDEGVISSRLHGALFDRAFTAGEGPEQAWALMSIVEHAFYRLYLRPQ